MASAGAEGAVSPDLKRSSDSKPHLYSIETATELSLSRDAGLSSPAMFRTTTTSAVAVEDASNDEVVLSASDTSEEPDSAQIHAVLEMATTLLQPGDRCLLSVALESNCFLVVVKHSEEQSAILGLEKTDTGLQLALVVPVQGLLKLDGDGGFNFTPLESRRVYQFKPASVRSLWSAVQVLMKLLETAQTLPAGPWLWIDAYRPLIPDSAKSIARWSVELPEKVSELDLIRRQLEQSVEKPSQTSEDLQQALIVKLKEVMFASDLDTLTSKDLRAALEKHFGFSMKEHRTFIDNQMIVIMGQMEKASKIFDYLFLGTEWNACNMEELEANNCKYIINVTKEIANFFPDRIKYHSIRVYDTSATKLLPHWETTFRFIREARRNGSSVLVHCKMGVSRSASTVIAYAMKQYSWSLDSAYAYVKKRRRIVNPNDGFRQQLIVYEGILRANRDSGSWGRRLLGPVAHAPQTRKDSKEIPAEVAAMPYCHDIGRVTPPSSPHTSPPSSPVPGRSRDVDNLSDDDKGETHKRRLHSFSGGGTGGSPGASDSDELTSTISAATAYATATAAAAAAAAAASADPARPYVAQMVARFLSEDGAVGTAVRTRARSMSPSVRVLPRPTSLALDYQSAESLTLRDVAQNAPPEADELGRSAPDTILQHASRVSSRSATRPSSRPVSRPNSGSFATVSCGPAEPPPSVSIVEPIEAEAEHMVLSAPVHADAPAMFTLVSAGVVLSAPIILEPGLVSVTSTDEETAVSVTTAAARPAHSYTPSSRIAMHAASAFAALSRQTSSVFGGDTRGPSAFGDDTRGASVGSAVELREIEDRSTQTTPPPAEAAEAGMAELRRDLASARAGQAVLSATIAAMQQRLEQQELNFMELFPAIRRLEAMVDVTTEGEDDGAGETAAAMCASPALDVAVWSASQVAAWLRGVGLASMAGLVEREGVAGQALLELTHDDLRALGLAMFAERRLVLRAVARLRRSHNLAADAEL